MEWGPYAEALAPEAEDEEVPRPLLDRPALSEHLAPVMDGYLLLRRSRACTMAGPQPIPPSEMLAMLRIMGVPRRERADWAALWSDLDEADRERMAEIRRERRGEPRDDAVPRD